MIFDFSQYHYSIWNQKSNLQSITIHHTGCLLFRRVCLIVFPPFAVDLLFANSFPTCPNVSQSTHNHSTTTPASFHPATFYTTFSGHGVTALPSPLRTKPCRSCRDVPTHDKHPRPRHASQIPVTPRPIQVQSVVHLYTLHSALHSALCTLHIVPALTANRQKTSP